jgi:RNA polymerase sigma-32 factor
MPNTDSNLSPMLKDIIRRAKSSPRLTQAEENKLHDAYLAGNKKAGDQLVERHLYLTIYQAEQWHRRGYPFEDVFSQGSIGLMKALVKFNQHMGARFSTYAQLWITASAFEYIRTQHSVIHTAAMERTKPSPAKLRAIYTKLLALHGSAARNIVTDKIAAITSMSLHEIEDMLGHMDCRVSSLDEPQNKEDDANPWIESLADLAQTPEDNAIQIDLVRKRRDILATTLERLKPRDADIIRRRHLTDKPETLETISNIYGVTRERIRQIEQQALDDIFRYTRRPTELLHAQDRG